ncbi:hypothetical protein BH10CYA1_BH10CYA1_04240 [soil metagenome]
MHPIRVTVVVLALLLIPLAPAASAEDQLRPPSSRRDSKPLIRVHPDRYFPKLLSDTRQTWYSKHLVVMGETSIQTLPKPKIQFVFRFLWLRTFHHPMAICVTKYSDGKTTLSAKELSGQGGYEPGHLIKEVHVDWTKKEFEQLQSKLNKVKFFDQISVNQSNTGADGAQWIFEVNDFGRYHFVDRSCPTGPDRDLGIFLLKAASVLPTNKSDIY